MIDRGNILPRSVPPARLALMQRMGIETLYRRPSTPKPTPGHTTEPYLLRNLVADRPNQLDKVSAERLWRLVKHKEVNWPMTA